MRNEYADALILTPAGLAARDFRIKSGLAFVFSLCGYIGMSKGIML